MQINFHFLRTSVISLILLHLPARNAYNYCIMQYNVSIIPNEAGELEGVGAIVASGDLCFPSSDFSRRLPTVKE